MPNNQPNAVPLSWNCPFEDGTCTNCGTHNVNVHQIQQISGGIEKVDDKVKIFKFVQNIGVFCFPCILATIGVK